MNRIKSLALTFTLAAASLVGLNNRAEAQTVPINPGEPLYGQTYNATSYVSQDAINDVAYNVGVQEPFYCARLGYTSAIAQNGENIGLEFELKGGQATVIRAFNLNNTYSANSFERARAGAAAVEDNLALNTRVYVQTYPSFIICEPVRPILGIGWLLRPHGWVDPFYRDHGRNWDFDHHRPHPLPLFPPPHRDLGRFEDHRRWEQPRDDHRHWEQPRNDNRWDNNRGNDHGRDDRGHNDRGGQQQQHRGPRR